MSWKTVACWSSAGNLQQTAAGLQTAAGRIADLLTYWSWIAETIAGRIVAVGRISAWIAVARLAAAVVVAQPPAVAAAAAVAASSPGRGLTCSCGAWPPTCSS